jgi:hypothetical protein
MKYLTKKIIPVSGVALFLFLVTIFPAQAKFNLASMSGGDVQSVTDIAQSRVESNMGVNPAEMTNMVQIMNTSRQKKNPPAVSIMFTPSDPTEGEKITAMATTTYFMNDVKKLYFTWFLKTSDCGRTNSPNTAQSQKCDLNGDGRVDIADWKIKATRIIANDDFDWENADYAGSSDSDGYDAVTGGDDQRGKNGRCYVHDTSSGNEYPIDCGHLFPHAPGETTGDDSFGRQEEEYWHTDPGSDDTAHTGNSDEANVAGLGIQNFTWVYNEGDEVGVVVEGVSVEPTQFYDSSMKTMWAMPVSMCDVKVNSDYDYPKRSSRVVSVTTDTPDIGQTTTVTEATVQTLVNTADNYGTVTTTITTTTTVTDSLTEAIISESSVSTSSDNVVNISNDISVANIKRASDLNECLYDNLVSPANNGPQSEKLNVELSYSPISPMNDPASYTDPSLSTGDYLTVQSAIANGKDNSYLQYTWEVFASDEANPDSWGDAILRSNLPESSQMIGLGLETFKFKLNLKNPKKYLKIKLTVRENVGPSLFREGHNYVVVPINSTGNQIRAYTANASDSPSPVLSKNAEICTSEIDKAVCPVAKNQIIRVEVNPATLSDFLWTINGKIFTYQSCYFSECNPNKQTNVAYFPILKEKGDHYTVNLTATNQNTGAKINLTKVFEVADPQIRIISASQSSCGPNLLGNYIDLDGKAWPDYSKVNYWATAGGSISLVTEATGFTPSPNDIVWFVDGETVNGTNAAALGYSVDTNGVLTLPGKLALESYSVTVNALYYQSEAMKRALKVYWSLTYDQLYEKVSTHSITITMQDSAPVAMQKNGQKIFASLFLSTPSYLAFLLRITLTALIIIFTSRLIFIFFPKAKEN